MVNRILLFALLIVNSLASFSQLENFRFVKYEKEFPNESTAFAVKYDGIQTIENLKLENLPIKAITKNWIYTQATPSKIRQLMEEKKITQFYFEFHNGQALSDSALIYQHVKEVHDGYGDLIRAYTGKKVLLGFVDQGLDWTHPDFIDSNGVKRVVAYWDQSAATNYTAPQPYNYGQSCDSLSIANGTCTLTEYGTYHGTTVTGAAAGNGRANGKNKGMAPDTYIVAIETNFNRSNWTLTVADACDYLFKIADRMGIPAVMNLSVGSYFGSHDGNDPASELMEQLIEEKNGRMIIGAAGNSGHQGNYHLKGNIVNDTNFVWFKNNPLNQITPNSIYFDWWSDTLKSNQLQISFAANNPITFEETPALVYRSLKTMSPYTLDTLRLADGTRLAVLEMYRTLVGDSYNIEALIRNYDSTHYLFKVIASGFGEFDLWSGEWSSLNNMVENVPSATIYPPIVKYLYPDSLSTIVSSWACSEKIVTVGNIRNRLTHINNNGVQQPYSPLPPVGYISYTSSRGPSRKNVIKPDVSASGEMMMGSAPAYMRTNSIYNTSLELGGWHARNGGTSMASPVVAGIAALYLEKCPTSSQKDFIRDLHQTSETYYHYGPMPNYTYGFGRINAYKLLVHNGRFSNDLSYCGASYNLGIDSLSNIRDFQWNTGDTTAQITINQPGTYEVTFSYGDQCYSKLTKEIGFGAPPIQPIITENQNILTSTSAYQYQWYLNGNELFGETSQTLSMTQGGNYQVKVADSVGCSNYSEYYRSTLGIETIMEEMSIHPNPTTDILYIQSNQPINKYSIYSISGQLISEKEGDSTEISVNNLATGSYILRVENDFLVKSFKIVKN